MYYKPTLKSALDRDCTTLSRHVLQQLQSSAARRRTQCPDESHRPRWQDHCSSSQPCWVNGRVLGFTGDINVQGESVKRWMSMPMMFYLGIQAKWLRLSLASEEMENHTTFRELPIGRYTLPI